MSCPGTFCKSIETDEFPVIAAKLQLYPTISCIRDTVDDLHYSYITRDVLLLHYMLLLHDVLVITPTLHVIRYNLNRLVTLSCGLTHSLSMSLSTGKQEKTARNIVMDSLSD